MLVKIREKSKGIVAYIIVGLIAVVMSLWGVDSLFTAMRGDPTEMASVNGEGITEFQVDQVAQRQMRQLLQNQQIDPEQLDLNLLRQFALNQLIQEALLRQKADELKLRVPDRQVERQIVRMPVFQDDQGRFQQGNFVQLLQQEGLTSSAFRVQLRNEMLNQQLLGGFADTEFVLSGELNEFQRLIGQQRSYRYQVLNAEDFLSQVQISADELQAFYDQQASRFMTPEQIQVDYVIFDPATLAAGITISEQALQDEYQRFVAALQAQSTSYNAAHILLTYKGNAEKEAAIQRLEAARQEILAGASFADVASELSEDSATARRGGELGPVQPGTLDDRFEAALFALEQPGDLSVVVESDFGLHLIQLVAREDADIPSFESRRDELKTRALAQPLRAATTDKLEHLRNLSFSADSLAEVAEGAELPLQQSEWLPRENLSGIWAQSSVRNALFSRDVVQDGWITEPLALEDGRYLVLSRKAYQPREQQSLADVEDQVRELLTQRQASELARKAAEASVAQLEAGTAVAGQWREITEVTRNNPEVPREINREAFRLSEKDPVGLLTLEQGDVVLLQLQQVRDGEISENPLEQEQLQQLLVEDRSYRLQAQLVNQLQLDAEIELR